MRGQYIAFFQIGFFAKKFNEGNKESIPNFLYVVDWSNLRAEVASKIVNLTMPQKKSIKLCLVQLREICYKNG